MPRASCLSVLLRMAERATLTLRAWMRAEARFCLRMLEAKLVEYQYAW